MEIGVKAPVEGSIGERLTLCVIQDPRNMELAGEHPFRDLLAPLWAKKGA